MPHHIGIVACSPPGAALCFETLCTADKSNCGPIEVSVHAHDFQEYMRFVDRADWGGVAALMLRSAHNLARQGAQLLVAPCNTIHAAFDHVLPKSPLPWLHIAEEIAREAKRRHVQRLGLLGTRSVMEGPVYRDKLHASGIEQVIPPLRNRVEIDRLIFDELVHGIVKEETREYFRMQLENMRIEGCDAVGLCCTELPLIVNGNDSTVPLLDSTRVLAFAAVERCARSMA